MRRIVYILYGSAERPTGGHKVSIRHVEALVELGLDAVAVMAGSAHKPDWLAHSAPILDRVELRPDDIVVLPEDATDLLKRFAAGTHETVVFNQNHFYAGATGLGRLSREELARFETHIACSPSAAAWIARYLPHKTVAVVPAFADERRFQPGEKHPVIALTPRKRPVEAAAIRFMFARLYRGSARWEWQVVQNAGEAEVAAAFGRASVFLSLSRLEGLGMTTLEAMASGCVPVGFTGIGGRDYASAQNGFWVGEDECEEAAHALVRATELVERNPAGWALMRDEAQRTAGRYSRAAFLAALETFWRPRAG